MTEESDFDDNRHAGTFFLDPQVECSNVRQAEWDRTDVNAVRDAA